MPKTPDLDLDVQYIGDRVVAMVTENIEAQLRAAVIAYSEWLEVDQDLFAAGTDTGDRSHEELVDQFIRRLTGRPTRRPYDALRGDEMRIGKQRAYSRALERETQRGRKQVVWPYPTDGLADDRYLIQDA